MNLVSRYKKLIMWNKIGLWGSICSILSIVLWITISHESRTTIKVKDSKNPVVQNMQDSPGGVQQNMQDSTGSVQLAIGHADNVTVNTTLSPRILPPTLAQTVVDHLKKQEPATIQIRSILGDQESLALATQIAELFKQAGWEVNLLQWAYSKPFRQIVFESPHTLHREGIANAVFLLLDHLGQKPSLYRLRSLQPNHYRLCVGSQ